jgi:hypothetical protein
MITEPDEWVAFLDDDTLLPGDYDSVIVQAIKDHPKALGFVFQQLDNSCQLRNDVSPEGRCSFLHNVGGYPRGTPGCDTGQMLFQRRLIGDIKWRDMQAADHEFYQDVVTRRGRHDDVCWLRAVGSIYNVLRSSCPECKKMI